MEMMLAENIRRFRKERSLTQEQLSEVLGVTAGAVYKWEAKLSVPDLDLIMEMADFFDTSVDVLLGYEMKDNGLEATVKRLQEYRRRKDKTGLTEAEKALKKYPHSFDIVRECGALYRGFAVEGKDKELFLRALELQERSLLLIGQNTDPEISEQTIYGNMATTYLGLDETDKAIELLKAHNAGGLYNHEIGRILAMSDRTEEAAPFLSEALAKTLSNLINTVTGYMNVFVARDDFVSAEAILHWGIETLLGLRKENKANFFDKVNSAMLAAMAFTQMKQGRSDEAYDSLRKARELAKFFDASPSYDESDIRFIDRIEGASAHDDIGATAMDAIGRAVEVCESEELMAMWQAVKEENRNE